MDYTEFSAKIKAKYPQYNDIPDDELASKMVAKFPTQYGDVKLKDAVSASPAIPDTSSPDHPDNTMQYLARMAKAIYGASSIGIQQSVTDAASQLGQSAGASIAASGPAIKKFALEQGPTMAAAGLGAAAATPYAPMSGQAGQA